MFKFLRRLKSPHPAQAAAASTHQPYALNPEQLLSQLAWKVIRRLDGQLQGDYRTLFRGSGVELANLREYQASDDVRHIDWNVTARMQTPYVRQHQEDREMTAYFVLDLSGSVGFGSKHVSKRKMAVACVAVLAKILVRRGNPVGALLFSGGQAKAERVLPARTGKSHVLQLMHAIDQFQTPPQTPMTDLRSMLVQAQNHCKKRSTVFVVSDFISDSGWDTALGALAHRHEVIAIRLQDPWEKDLPSRGLFTVQDAETGEQVLVDANHRGLREAYARLSQAREVSLQKTFEKSHVDCLTLRTDADLGQALLDFMLRRKKVARAGATSHHAVAITA